MGTILLKEFIGRDMNLVLLVKQAKKKKSSFRLGCHFFLLSGDICACQVVRR